MCLSTWCFITTGKPHGRANALMQSSSLGSFEGPSLLCQFSREKREMRALWEQHMRRVTAIREQRWQSAGPLSCNGLHLSLAGFQVGWYKYLSKPIKDQLVFIRLNETQLLAQESKQWLIELPQKVMFSAYLNTPLISNRDLCKSLTNNKCHFCLLFLVIKSYLTLLRPYGL